MKHIREIKVGVLAIICAVILYFGFNFLKGINIFSSTDYYYGYFDRTNGLTEQAPVYILGHKVGLVMSIDYDFTRTPAFIVGINVDKGINLPKETKMALVADGLLGGAAIELIMPQESTATAYQAGDTLTTIVMPGLVENLQAGVLSDLSDLLNEINQFVVTLNNVMDSSSLHASLKNIERLTADLTVSGRDIRNLTHKQLPEIMTKVDNTMNNLEGITESVKGTDIPNTIAKIDSTINLLNTSLTSKEGTLGLLLNDTELHDNLNTALKNLDNAVLNVDTILISVKARPFIKKKLPKND